MNYEEIAAMLAAGKSSEEIAQEFTDALNKAIEEDTAAKKAAEAKKVQEEKDKELWEIATDIANALHDYIMVAGFDGVGSLSAAEVREVLDEFLPVIESLKNIKIKVDKVPTKVKSAKSIDDVFADFFRSMNI